MSTVLFETDACIFEFDPHEVRYALKLHKPRYNAMKVRELNDLLNSDSDAPVVIPDVYGFFGYIVLDLISQKKGSVTCKTCNARYKAEELKPVTVGQGKNPITLKEVIKNLFKKKMKLPGLLGGKGFVCPFGHTLIEVITWRT